MTLEQKKELIIAQNKPLLEEVVRYITANQIKSVYELLNKLKDRNYEARVMRQEREKLRQDLDDLNRAFVKSDTFSDGMPKAPFDTTPPDSRQILKLQLIHELEQKTIESLQFEKALHKRNKIFIQLIDIAPRYNDVLKLTYIDGLSASQAADTLFLSIGSVCSFRKRAIKDLEEILEKVKVQ